MSVLENRGHRYIYLAFAIIWALPVYGMLSASAGKSTDYQVIETSLGGTGLLNSKSNSYETQQSGAIIGIGTSTGTNYQVKAGHETTSAPALSIGILTSNPTFGTFSPTATETSTSQFSVIDYTSYGYIVEMYGNPPTNAYGHQIKALTSNGAPTTGTEEYGFNLVANTNPINFGAAPNTGQFGVGDVATNYNTANSYRFNSGEEIAYAPKSSGQTIYTISYIVDVSSITPGGQYISTQNLICIPTY